MRKIVYGINLTADGLCDHTQLSGGEEIHTYFTNLMKDVDLIIYGRKTYELMVPYWPEVAKNGSGNKEEIRFAQTFNAIEKVVCSRSMQKFEGNPRVISENLEAEILKLKSEPGKNISIGGVDLPSQLIALGLVDEYYFLVHPLLGCQGRRLLDGISLSGQVNLKLAESRTLPSGCISIHYTRIYN